MVAPDNSGDIVTGALGTSMRFGQIVDAVTTPCRVQTILAPGATVAVSFGNFGHNAYRVLMDQNCTLSVSGGVQGQLQTMRLILQQPVAGNCVMAWPSDIVWADKAPFVDSRIGSTTIVEIMWDGQSTYYGSLIYG